MVTALPRPRLVSPGRRRRCQTSALAYGHHYGNDIRSRPDLHDKKMPAMSRHFFFGFCTQISPAEMYLPRGNRCRQLWGREPLGPHSREREPGRFRSSKVPTSIAVAAPPPLTSRQQTWFVPGQPGRSSISGRTGKPSRGLHRRRRLQHRPTAAVRQVCGAWTWATSPRPLPDPTTSATEAVDTATTVVDHAGSESVDALPMANIHTDDFGGTP